MNNRHLIAFFAPLAFALPAAAEWSTDATAEFTRECVASAPSDHSEAQLKAYCECAADKISSEFTEDELQAMGRQSPPDPELQRRLLNASSSCDSKLQ
ncbi:MAG TPA: hypothetical protein VFF22_17750 [Pseudomonas sp.]|nr:hypothetical protein [Pseudomonas sp.]